MRRVESEPAVSVSMWGSTPSKFDENSVSQINEPALPLAELPVDRVRAVRGAPPNSDQFAILGQC